MQQVTAAAGCSAQEQQPIAPSVDVQQGTDAVSGSNSSSSQMPLVQERVSAVEAGDSSRVQQLLDRAKLDMTDSKRADLLCCAAVNGRSEVVAALLAAGVPVDAASLQGLSALHYAARNGHNDTLQVLLKAGADVGARGDDGTTPLFDAAARRHLLVVRELLAAGASCDARCVNGFTPLYEASAYGHVSVVKALLAAGADVMAASHCGSTALSVAASEGQADVVRLLMSGGAVRSKQHWTDAAKAAVQHGRLDVLNALVAAPAELQERNCLLAQACLYEQTAMIEHLLSIGLQSSLSSCRGYSAMEVVAMQDHVGVVMLLLHASKQQAPTDAQVLKAAFWAAHYRHHGVLAQLLLHLHKSGDKVHESVSALVDQPAARMALLQGWAADAAQQQQQQQALVALEQDMASSRPVLLRLLFAVQRPAVRPAAAQQAALPQRQQSTWESCSR